MFMIFTMAWRNIWRNKMRSIIIMLSIAVGLFAGIAVLALYKGIMTARVRIAIDAEVGHIQLHDVNFKKDYDPKFIIDGGDATLNAIRKIPGVKSAVPRSITNGMLATATGGAGVQINGIIPEQEYEASQLKKKIIEGIPFDIAKKNQVMIGKKLANKMRLKTGAKLVLTFTDTSGNIVSGAFRVVAIYQSANAPLDERNVYIRIADMNALLTSGRSFHEITLLLDKDDQLPVIKQQLQQIFPAYKIESWKEISPETDLMVNTTNQMSYIIMAIIMFALAFGIINTMLMAILERTREIGLMMALGTAKLKIFFLVLLETVFLTLAGTPIGIFTALLAVNYYNKNGLDISGMGKEMMNSFGYSTVIYPEFPSDKFAAVMMIVFITAIISCLFPGIKALKLKPVEALQQ